MIIYFKPKLLAMCGIAAGFRNVTKIGDILVATQSWEYDAGKKMMIDGQSVFQPDPSSILIPPEVLDIFLKAGSESKYIDKLKREWPGDSPSHDLSVCLGPLGTGTAVVKDSNVEDSILQSSRKCIGLDMETYALYYSAINSCTPQPKFISIKSVSDHADELKSDKFQRFASYMSAGFLKQCIINDFYFI
jgi:nucleoside phosphorylase